ncbi:MAG: transcription elongation factor NusA [Nitrososphaeraceae archaeon]
MKTPICVFDAKTGVLCSKCESKLKSGHISQGDVDASIKLTKIEEKNNDIKQLTLVAAHRIEDDTVLIMPNSDITAIRMNNEIIKDIKKEFPGDIWFIENGATEKRFIENLMYPLKISTMNLVWLPDDNKLTKIVINRKKQSKNVNIHEINTNKIQNIAKEIKNIELLIDFEE